MATVNKIQPYSVVDPSLKQKDMELWKKWKMTKSQQDLEALFHQMENVIYRELIRQRGSLPDIYLEIEAKKFAKQAFETFDPTKNAALSTHLVNTLKQLSRLNMTYQSSVRAPEHQQRLVGDFINAKTQLKDEFGRTPTMEELSDYMGLNRKLIEKLEVGTRTELTDSKEIPQEMATSFDYMSKDIDPKIVFFYQGLSPTDKIIFEYTTGYGGKPVLPIEKIADEVKMNYSQITYIKRKMIQRLQTEFNMR